MRNECADGLHLYAERVADGLCLYAKRVCERSTSVRGKKVWTADGPRGRVCGRWTATVLSSMKGSLRTDRTPRRKVLENATPMNPVNLSCHENDIYP